MTLLLPDAPADDPTRLFCLSLPGLPRAWDSVLLGLLKDCPRKLKYFLDGWMPSGFAAHLEFGIAYHKALEHFDIDLARGLSREEALHNMVKFCMSYGTRDADGNFIPYDAAYTGEAAKTRETLVRSTIWYQYHYAEDPCQTVILRDGTPAVELSFEINLELDTPDGEPFRLCGHLDRLVIMDDDYYWMDRKTSKSALNKRYWNQFVGPNNQFSIYSAASQLILHRPAKGGIVDAVELGATYARFARKPITKTPGQYAEWLNDLYHWLLMAVHYASEDYWPMNDTACTKYNGCPFINICGLDPKVREGFLKHEGFLRRRWNPLEKR